LGVKNSPHRPFSDAKAAGDLPITDTLRPQFKYSLSRKNPLGAANRQVLAGFALDLPPHLTGVVIMPVAIQPQLSLAPLAVSVPALQGWPAG
jgi:hypothetical protein